MTDSPIFLVAVVLVALGAIAVGIQGYRALTRSTVRRSSSRRAAPPSSSCAFRPLACSCATRNEERGGAVDRRARRFDCDRDGRRRCGNIIRVAPAAPALP